MEIERRLPRLGSKSQRLRPAPVRLGGGPIRFGTPSTTGCGSCVAVVLGGPERSRRLPVRGRPAMSFDSGHRSFEETVRRGHLGLDPEAGQVRASPGDRGRAPARRPEPLQGRPRLLGTPDQRFMSARCLAATPALRPSGALLPLPVWCASRVSRRRAGFLYRGSAGFWLRLDRRLEDPRAAALQAGAEELLFGCGDGMLKTRTDRSPPSWPAPCRAGA